MAAVYSIYFLSMALVGLTALVLMHFVGEGDHDYEPSHFSLISLRVLILFITGFGLGGFAGAWHSVWLATTFGVIGGSLFVVTGAAIIRFFIDSQANSTHKLDKMIGHQGRLTTGIPKGGTGEASFIINGMPAWYAAVSHDGEAIHSPSAVVVVGTLGGSVVVKAVMRVVK